MSEYKTSQKKLLYDFLAANSDTPLSVEEIAEKIKEQNTDGIYPGTSTVYRLINRLVEDGCVKRYAKGRSRQFLYQLADGENCHRHLHMKCTCCGKLLHMDDATSELIVDALEDNSSFCVDREETTIFGRCDKCKRER